MADKNTDIATYVNADAPIEASEYNILLNDARYFGSSTTNIKDTEDNNVSAFELFEFYIQNVRPEILSATVIRVPFSNDRPPSLMIDNHLIRNEANADSPAYSGTSGTKYIAAVRDGKRFTIEVRNSAAIVEDERIIATVEWDGASFKTGTVVSYEIEGVGGITETNQLVARAWGYFNSAGSLQDSENIQSVAKTATGTYLVSLTNAMANVNYVVVATLNGGTGEIYIVNKGTTSFEIKTGSSSAGASSDRAAQFVVYGDLA